MTDRPTRHWGPGAPWRTNPTGDPAEWTTFCGAPQDLNAETFDDARVTCRRCRRRIAKLKRAGEWQRRTL